MILVMGATGNIGSKISKELLAQGLKVRCLARRFPDKGLFPGAEFAQGDANSVSFLSSAMRGCSAIFTMLPANTTAPEMRFYQNKLGEVIAEAVEEANIKKIVNLSSLGADLNSGTGPILGLHDQEERLNEITHADIIHLRPTYFMENLLSGIPSIISMNLFFGTIAADKPVPMIATQDIALRAAFLLMNPTFKGRNIEYLLGERDLTHREIIRVIAHTIDKPELEYIEVPAQEMKNYQMGAGISEDWANGMLEVSKALSNGYLAATAKRTTANTTGTSIEEFAKTTFLDAYRNAVVAETLKKQGPPAPFPEIRI